MIPDFYWSSRPLKLGTKPPFKLTIEEIQAGDPITPNLGLHSLSPGNTGRELTPGLWFMSLVFSIVQSPHGAFIHWIWSGTAPARNSTALSTPSLHILTNTEISRRSYSLHPLGSLRIFFNCLAPYLGMSSPVPLFLLLPPWGKHCLPAPWPIPAWWPSRKSLR